MRNRIKQYFCLHEGTQTTTEVNTTDSLFMIVTRIMCTKCLKVFAQHPNAECCYVNHLHGETMRHHMLNNMYERLNKMKQP